MPGGCSLPQAWLWTPYGVQTLKAPKRIPVDLHCLHDRALPGSKRLWMSEYGDGDASGMEMAHEIVRDIRDMQAQAWVYWQVIDGGGWGCLDMHLNSGATSYRINRKYYAFA